MGDSRGRISRTSEVRPEPRPAVGNSDLVMLRQELEAKNQQTDALTMRMADAVAENGELNDKLQRLEWDHNKIVTTLETRSQEKDKTIKRLQAEIVSNRAQFDQEKYQIAEQFQKQIAEMSGEIAKLTNEIEERNEERAAIDKWRKLQTKMTEELAALKKEVEDSQRKHKEDLINMRGQQQLVRRQWRVEKDKEIAEVRERAKEEARQEIDKTIQTVLTFNEELRKGREVSESKLLELAQRNKRMVEKNRELGRDQELNLQMHEQNAKKSQRQAKLIKELNRKVASLETALSAVVREFDSERETILNQTARELEEYKLEAGGLQKLVELKNKELRHIKRLAQVILDARTELEQFFLDSIEIVKSEIRQRQVSAYASDKQQYEQDMKKALTTGGPFPAIRQFKSTTRTGNGARQRTPTTNATSSARAVRASGAVSGASTFMTGVDEETASVVSSQASLVPSLDVKIDIRQLSWEDRERVLRLLFAKMNGIELESLDRSSVAAGSPAGGMDLVPEAHDVDLDVEVTDDDLRR